MADGNGVATGGVPRVLLLVCDSFGVGEAPDAAAYGDAGSNTIGHVASFVGGLHAPNLAKLGLGSLTEVAGVPPGGDRGTAHGRQQEQSAGKDTITGHWEIAGIVLDRPFPTYPKGFPPDVIEPFERAVGRTVLGNKPASGTEIIEELGEEHLRTGRPIVYTSADSVFQVACHVRAVPLEQLYDWCRIARNILDGEHRVGRVIARPFDGEPGAFVRRPERRDYSVPPPGRTVLDFIRDAGIPVYGVGKIRDIFDGRGLSEFSYSDSNDHGVDLSIDFLRRPGTSLVFTNLVDFDSKYGHRNDPSGYAKCIEALDPRIPELEDAVGEGLMLITGDHGCDPTDTSSTDHTREYTPVLIAGARTDTAIDLGVRKVFGDVGLTVADALGVEVEGLAGTSFAAELGLGEGADG
ncbi:MAG TPA: phosphopentomutase [Actinomycetota bacterium]|nr:phosphopentomutase [Actinomycetota bacterium]